MGVILNKEIIDKYNDGKNIIFPKGLWSHEDLHSFYYGCVLGEDEGNYELYDKIDDEGLISVTFAERLAKIVGVERVSYGRFRRGEITFDDREECFIGEKSCYLEFDGVPSNMYIWIHWEKLGADWNYSEYQEVEKELVIDYGYGN